jgi:hypothetical protein
MAKGVSKGKVVASFHDQVIYLITQNDLCAKASTEAGRGRVWMLGSWVDDTTDLTGMKKAFDRSEIINTMNGVMDKNSPGTTADKVAMKFQSDYLGAMDRAFRTRHAGTVRSEIFAASRRSLLASSNLADSTLSNVQRILARGQG